MNNDLFLNVIKLAEGLRNLGQHQYAAELEENLLNYKRAFKEKAGEALIHEAHPKGSVQVGEGPYGILEDIIDQHLKIVKIVEKTPTGKYASFKTILKDVKIALAEDKKTEADWLNKIRKNVADCKRRFEDVLSFIKDQTDWKWKLDNMLGMYSQDVFNEEATVENLNKMKNTIKRLYASLSPGILWDSVPEEVFGRVKPRFNEMFNLINEATDLRKKYDQSVRDHILEHYEKAPENANDAKPAAPAVPVPIANFNREVAASLRTLDIFEAKVQVPENSVEDQKAALGWITKKRNEINSLKSNFDNRPQDIQLEIADRMLSSLNNIKNKQGDSFAEFQKGWIE